MTPSESVRIYTTGKYSLQFPFIFRKSLSLQNESIEKIDMIVRKIVLLFFIDVISISYLFAQINCNDIRIDSSTLSVGTVQCPIRVQDFDMARELYHTISFEKNCHDNYVEIICTFQNGNDYFVENQIYTKENDAYKQVCKYYTYSKRNSYELYGEPGNGNSLLDIVFNADSYKILLRKSVDIQTKENTKFYYRRLLARNKKDEKVLCLLAFAFISGKEQITTGNVKTIKKLARCLNKNKNYKVADELLQLMNRKGY